MKQRWTLCLALLAACTSGPGTQGGEDLAAPPSADLTMVMADLASAMDLAASPDLTTAGYPPGPYGNQVGDTIAPLVWKGYAVPKGDALAKDRPYAAYAMDTLRTSGARLALLHASDDF